MREWKLRKYWATLMLVLFAGLAACEDSATEPEPVVESQLLVDYLEANRSYDVHGGFVIKAENVRTTQVTEPGSQYIIDIRAADAYTAGHIDGAVNVPMGELLGHLASLSNAAAYDQIVLVCYSGQSAAYATGVARAAGYENVFSMKWGMSSWHTDTSGPWLNNRSNEFALLLETGASPAKPAPGELPTLNTGFETPEAIMEARATAVMTEFGDAKIPANSVFQNTDGFFIINYWPQAKYEAGHIPSAIMYEPATKPFEQDADLLTLPVDRPVVVYCYTGQTSAYLAGYLRMLGYDARTLLFGANGMFFDNVPGARFVPENEVKDYPMVTT
jgi:rhodanese-related sulfurtransferase